ncbi:MAG: hypothetical protein M3443_03700 [Actinomycetota bacterium]|nr:hypothetical protein [Actinomycetota bacterium]
MTRGRGLIVLAGALLVVVAAVYAVATFSGTYVNGTPRDEAVYRWDGGTILVRYSSSGRGCTVTPDTGETRVVRIGSVHTGRSGSATELTPWFSSAATIRCASAITVWSGWAVGLREFTLSSAFVPVSAAVVALPVLLAVVRTRSHGRRDDSESRR